MPDYSTYTAVEQLANGDITLVGEDHDSERSADLAGRVIDDIQPETICIEMPPGYMAGSAAMQRGIEYAAANGKPVVTIDESQDARDGLDCSRGELNSVANRFSYPVEESGDVDPRAIADARHRVREQFGDEAYQTMYIERERGMANRMAAVLDELQSPIVAHVGAFHVPALRDMWFATDGADSIADHRIHNHQTDGNPRPSNA